MVKKPRGNTILCIENEEDIRSFACKVLELEGYRCLQAEGSDVALRLLDSETINLIMLDLKLAEDDGWQILKKIKENPKTAVIPVLICTALRDEAQQERALNMGAVDYLIKPLSANILREAVFRILPIMTR